MPRSGWIAGGVVLGAIEALVMSRAVVLALGLVAGAVALGLWTMFSGSRSSDPGRRPGSGLVTPVALLALGLLMITARMLGTPASGPRPSVLPVGDGPWTARVESIGPQRAGQQPAILLFDPPAGLRVAGSLPLFPGVVPGDRVRLMGALRPPPENDPYGDYLARIGVGATLRTSSLSLAPPADDLGSRLEGLRRGADQAIRLGVPEPEAGLASGIIIGLRDRVDRDLAAAFTAVGATHVVAISGWNIAIVAATLAALAGRLARRRRAVLTAVAIVGYVVFVGPSPSVVRAAGMAGVVMMARELGRPSRAAAAIGWAVSALLLVDPRLIEDAGFQLSALATVGLIAWGTPFAARIAGSSPGRLRAWLAESLGVSLAAQLATLPVVVLTFGRLSLVAPVVNLVVVPLVAPAMGAGVVALAGGLLVMVGLPQVVATVAALPAWLLFSLMVGVVRGGASVPFASVLLAHPWDVLVAGASGLVIVAVMAMVRRRPRPSPGDPPAPGDRRRAAASRTSAQVHPGPRTALPRGAAGRALIGSLAVSVIALSVVLIHRPDGVPRVSVLDVGQGDAILVEGGHGGRLLVDGGPDPGRLLVALDEHLPPWDRRIDLVILSHPHEDHAAGLAALLQRYQVARVLEPGMIGPGPGYRALNAELVQLGLERGTLSTGDHLTVDEFHFRVLWPDPGTVPERPSDGGTAINNVSIVLLGEVDGHRLLLAGDIEEQIDPRLLARGLPTVDLLKVAHHGSRTSSTEPMIEALRPSLAVVSAGRGNPYGHPSMATLARLEDAGARVLRTDTNGTVTVDIGLGPLRVHTGGARVAGLADAAPGQAGVTAAISAASTPTASLFLCGLPAPSLGIALVPVASAGSGKGSAAASAGTAASAVGPTPVASPLGIPDLRRGADLARRLGYDAARDPRTSDRPPAALVALAAPRARAWRVRRRRRRPRCPGSA